tara:strand:+ start:494 stop:730 length:237 start_codon:yes stop_codon:yes gene_type:complete
MKKILITTLGLAAMSFTTNQVMNTYLLSEAINDVQDVREWIKEDVYNGRIDQNVAVDYIEVLDQTEDRLIKYSRTINK